jgi:PhnB protein
MDQPDRMSDPDNSTTPRPEFAMSVKPIPDGCNSISAYLIVKDGRKAIDFYANAFGGLPSTCMHAPDGSVMHGEVKIGNSTVMISTENPQWDMKSAETLGGSPVSLHVYVEDVDSAFKKALDAGCTQVSPVMDQFWGDRYGKVMDPFGFQWGLATHKEDLSDEEIDRRGQEWFAQMAQSGECATEPSS